MSDFEWTDAEPAAPVCIIVDGARVTVAADRSLLAGLLAAGDTGIEFFCAIGQCQRCIVRINGVARPACLLRPSEGDVVETFAHGTSVRRT
jgi:aerobic-type carbon monoxide dehydrogenase small subunit (CoxS/CutS family)